MTSKKKRNKRQEDEDREGGGASSSGSGVQFRDFLGDKQANRDDLLSAEEIRRLMVVHGDVHEIKVKKQKELRDQRKSVREGKVSLNAFRQGLMGGGLASQYKVNPILADKAQFSGIDSQVTPLPDENIAETNPDLRDALEHQYRLQNQPRNAPHFHPKPKPQ